MSSGKLEQLGEKAQTHAIKLKGEGLTHSAIATEINNKFDSDISERNVKDFLNRTRDTTFKVLKEKENFQEKLAKTYFNTLDQLNDLNKEIWDFFYEIKRNPEYKDKIIKCSKCGRKMVLNVQSYGLLLKAADHLLKQIEHVDKVLGRMKDKNLTVNYNFVDLSKKLSVVTPQLFHDAERRGEIKILKRKKFRLKNGR